MSRMGKKFMALLLVAIMTMGLGMTAFAAENASPNASQYDPNAEYYEWYNNWLTTDEEKLEYYAEYVYSKASIAAGIGSIASITDQNMQIKVMEQIKAVYDEYNATVNLKDYHTWGSMIIQEWAFDVQGVKSGEVTIKLGDYSDTGSVLNMKDFAGYLVVVSHYNETTGKWEKMDKLAEVDENGCITINFSSYSPIVIHLTNFTAADLAANSGISVYKTTMTPVATPLTAPKTADDVIGIYAAILGCAVVGLGITRKKMAR